jgi:hypothetical protein
MMSFAHTFHQTPEGQTRKREKHTAPETMDLDELTRGACEVEASGGTRGHVCVREFYLLFDKGGRVSCQLSWSLEEEIQRTMHTHPDHKYASSICLPKISRSCVSLKDATMVYVPV